MRACLPVSLGLERRLELADALARRLRFGQFLDRLKRAIVECKINLGAVILRVEQAHQPLVALRLEWRHDARVEIVAKKNRRAIVYERLEHGIALDEEHAKRATEFAVDQDGEHSPLHLVKQYLGEHLQAVADRRRDFTVIDVVAGIVEPALPEHRPRDDLGLHDADAVLPGRGGKAVGRAGEASFYIPNVDLGASDLPFRQFLRHCVENARLDPTPAAQRGIVGHRRAQAFFLGIEFRQRAIGAFAADDRHFAPINGPVSSHCSRIQLGSARSSPIRCVVLFCVA